PAPECAVSPGQSSRASADIPPESRGDRQLACFSHCTRDDEPASPKTCCSKGTTVARVWSSCHGGLSSNIPLPFIRSGESSGCTISSASREDFTGSVAARRKNWFNDRRSLIGYQTA